MSMEKCVCGKKFEVGDMIHEVSVTQGTYQQLCEDCYQFWTTVKDLV